MSSRTSFLVKLVQWHLQCIPVCGNLHRRAGNTFSLFYILFISMIYVIAFHTDIYVVMPNTLENSEIFCWYQKCLVWMKFSFHADQIFYLLGYMCNLLILKTCKQLKSKAKCTGTKHAGLDSVICGCGSWDCTEFLKGTGCLYKNKYPE